MTFERCCRKSGRLILMNDWHSAGRAVALKSAYVHHDKNRTLTDIRRLDLYEIQMRAKAVAENRYREISFRFTT